MWLMLSFFTVVGATVFFMHQRVSDAWSGKVAKLGELAYRYQIYSNKGSVYNVKIGIDCDTGLNFGLKPESIIDRFFKAIGLSTELQLRRASFDENIYIVSDDKRLPYILNSKKELYESLESIFENHRWPSFRMKKLWCRGGRLWVELKPVGNTKTKDMDAPLLANECLPLLKLLAATLTQTVPKSSGCRDYFVVKAGALVGFSTALAINGAIQLFRTGFMKFPVVLDNPGLLLLAAKVGLGLLIFLLVLCVYLLGRTSRAHLVFLELLLVGGFGSFTSSYVELRDYNIEMDTAAGVTVETVVSQQYTTRCGKNNRSTCYHITLAAKDQLTAPVTFSVDSTRYHQFPTGAKVLVDIHPGALGKAWITEPRR